MATCEICNVALEEGAKVCAACAASAQNVSLGSSSLLFILGGLGVAAVLLAALAAARKLSANLKGGRKNSKSVIFFTCLGIAVPLLLVLVLAFFIFVAQGSVNEKANRLRRSAMLRDLYVHLQTYKNDFGSLPSVQPLRKRYDVGGGVADLYPLYEMGLLDEKAVVELLQPPGRSYEKFSPEIKASEFNAAHIGFAYNSCAQFDTAAPLLADGGVSDGRLSKKALDKKGALVLFANGRIEFIKADEKSGKLKSENVEDWSLLKD